MPSLTLPLPPRFSLPRAVCSYGYFLLAPNLWVAGDRALHRPLRGMDDRVIHCVITQPARGRRLKIDTDTAPSAADRVRLKAQVTRMLRLDEDFKTWRALHPVARSQGFDRMFRSPALFEDVVKTMTGCNVTWPNTMRMNALLCEKVGGGAFPTPAQLAAVAPSVLRTRCKVGYRDRRIVLLARDVASERLDLDALDRATLPTTELFDELRRIHGVGEYAAGNILMLVGRYDRLAIDSETYRHFRQEHGWAIPENPKKVHDRIEQHYARYAPYQFMAYWFDLWVGYQKRFGDARWWDARTDGHQFTAAVMKEAPGAGRQGPGLLSRVSRSASDPPTRDSGTSP